MTARSLGSRANKDLERVYLSKKELRSISVVRREVAKKVKKYNADKIKTSGKSPDSKFSYSKRSIKRRFRSHDVVYLFGKVKEVTVRRAMVQFVNDKKEYTYRIEDRGIMNRYNRQKVKVYFYPFNPYKISLFDMENKFIAYLALHPEINQVPRTEEDIKAMQYLYLKNVQDVKDNVMELLEEIKVGETQLILETPIDILDNETYKELENLKTEDIDLMLKEFSVSKPYGKKIIKSIRNTKEESFEFGINENREIKRI